MPAPLRFIQLSDLHLGAPFAWLPQERRADRRREQQRALEDAVSLAIDRDATAILFPGDLFDLEGVDVETLAFAVHAFARPGCPPVFIAPGNHDPCTTTSLYWNPRLLGARGWAWPEHVHVFRDAAWSSFALPDSPLNVWGRSFVSSAPTFERPLAPPTLPQGPFDPSRVHVAVFHGSREHACPPYQAVTAPFTDDEALNAPFAYAAVGHYHRPSRIDGPDGRTRLAYAGSTVALDASEAGAHGALEVTLEAGAGARIEPLVLDSRRMHAIDVDVTGAAGGAEIDRRVLDAFAAAGVGERDIARVTFAGRIVKGVRYEGPGAEVAQRVFALRSDLRGVRPDYDLDAIRAREPATTEDRFVHALLAELDAEADPERRGQVLSAIYYGLDAFRLRDVAPGYEELWSEPEPDPEEAPA